MPSPNLRMTFRLAASLYRQYHVQPDEAFLSVWYLYHREMPSFSYHYVVNRVEVIRTATIYIPAKDADIYAQSLRLGPNPWPMHRDDLTYCRLCFRIPIYRRLRCLHCYKLLEAEYRRGKNELCYVPGCTTKLLSRGRCRKHYMRDYRLGVLWLPAEEREL